MIVNVINQQNVLPFDPHSVQPLVEQVVREEKQACEEVSIYFVETSEICRLHQEFFDDPSPTDCISFPVEEIEGLPYRILGDVFVCPNTALQYAREHQVDSLEEITLYIVHGLLHLMGYNDIEEEDITLMRQAEKRQMAKLKKLNLYLKPLID